MKLLNQIFSAFSVFLITLIGGSFLLKAFGMFPEWIESHLEDDIFLVLAGLFFFFIAFIAAGTARTLSTKEKTIHIEGPLGEIQIAQSAIETFLRKVAQEEPAVKDVESAVSLRKKGLLVKLRVIIAPVEKVPDVISRLQSSVRHGLEEVIGVTEVDRILVSVKRILPTRELRIRQ
jgi:hypothetical protein